MGQPLDGSYAALHAVVWALCWDAAHGLILEQQQGGAWVEVTPGQAFPALPRTARHIGLAFDQAARHVACWEDGAQIVVRQWDPGAQAYTYRGPFAGVDPLVWTDTTASYHSPDSDVVLIYLNTDRTEARCRLQRDAYGVEYPLVSGLVSGVLDQVVSLPYGAQLRGESGGAPVVIDLGLYPVRGSDTLAGAGGVSQGAYDQVVVAVGRQHALTGSGGVASGIYEPDILLRTMADTVSGTGAIASGAYDPTVVVVPVSNLVTGNGGVASGAYDLVLVPATTTDTMTGTGSISGGSYGP